jgi:hypothetical protein
MTAPQSTVGTRSDAAQRERLTVHNFLAIDDAEIDINRFTILIGPQATGKSVLARTAYFCRDLLCLHMRSFAIRQYSAAELAEWSSRHFAEIFPPEAWASRPFEIQYGAGASVITIRPSTASDSTPHPIIELSEDLAAAYETAVELLRPIAQAARSAADSRGADDQFDAALSQAFADTSISGAYQRSAYVPAGRAFFAELRAAAFTLLDGRVPISRIMVEFGRQFEAYVPKPGRDAFAGVPEDVQSDVQKILSGRYVVEGGDEYIEAPDRRTPLSFASSGQQAAVHLLLLLLRSAYQLERHRVSYFVEEPEAHLFPTSQKLLTGIFARIYNALEHNFVLTTHSPYILTAMNNLIMAQDVLDSQGEIVAPEIDRLVGLNRLVRYSDVSAYTIAKGTATSIMDGDVRLIGASVIDAVSDDFEGVFGELLELERT